MWSGSSRVLSPSIEEGRLFLEKPEGFDTIGDTLKEVCSSIEHLCEQQDSDQIRIVDLSSLDLTDAELSAILEALLEASVSPEDEVRLSNNRLSTRGLADLLEYMQSVMQPRQKLKVDLSCNGICDWGFQRLAILLSESMMQNVEVNIDQNRISNPGGILDAYMAAHREALVLPRCDGRTETAPLVAHKYERNIECLTAGLKGSPIGGHFLHRPVVSPMGGMDRCIVYVISSMSILAANGHLNLDTFSAEFIKAFWAPTAVTVAWLIQYGMIDFICVGASRTYFKWGFPKGAEGAPEPLCRAMRVHMNQLENSKIGLLHRHQISPQELGMLFY
ncbi:hypothetical protein FOZ63_000097 [Perkinsus olseni]|uniref:Uncharacterized protein n=1 Tax=Perkinsus olseni TaxID=32597 RepID=A0A7J6UG09_PEROL|nr:hypothetical protein FOZ63_000097 [Perkinsus olseni]